MTTADRPRASECVVDRGVSAAYRAEGVGIMLVALGAGEAGAVDQPVAVGTEWDDALVDLYRAQRLPLLRLAVLLTDDRGTAEDVVQDAFLALPAPLARGRPGRRGGLSADVGGQRRPHAATGAAASARRHLHAVRPEECPRPTSPCCSPRTSGRSSRRCGRCPARQREVLVLRYWSELSEAEIAAALGIARGTVKSSASRGLASLQKQLGDRRVR